MVAKREHTATDGRKRKLKLYENIFIFRLSMSLCVNDGWKMMCWSVVLVSLYEPPLDRPRLYTAGGGEGKAHLNVELFTGIRLN